MAHLLRRALNEFARDAPSLLRINGERPAGDTAEQQVREVRVYCAQPQQCTQKGRGRRCTLTCAARNAAAVARSVHGEWSAELSCWQL